MTGAIEMQFTYNDGSKTTEYVILPIHETRGSTPIFALRDGRGTHLLSAADIRGSWNGWVGELVRDDLIVSSAPAGVEVY